MATKKVSELDAIVSTALVGTDLILITQSGASKKITLEEFLKGKVVGFAYAISGAVVANTTAIPQDDTKPTWAEGFALPLLDTAYTPKVATNLLKVTVTVMTSNITSGSANILALFKDPSGVDEAIAVQASYTSGAGQKECITLTHIMVAGGTAATTFKLRIGNADGLQTTVNGNAGSRQFGGAACSSITVEEIQV